MESLECQSEEQEWGSLHGLPTGSRVTGWG